MADNSYLLFISEQLIPLWRIRKSLKNILFNLCIYKYFVNLTSLKNKNQDQFNVFLIDFIKFYKRQSFMTYKRNPINGNPQIIQSGFLPSCLR